MIAHNQEAYVTCIADLRDPTVDLTAMLMTAGLSLVYFGSRKVLKRGISPIGLIGLSAVAGMVVYSL